METPKKLYCLSFHRLKQKGSFDGALASFPYSRLALKTNMDLYSGFRYLFGASLTYQSSRKSRQLQVPPVRPPPPRL